MSAASSSLIVMFCIACAGGLIVCSIRFYQALQASRVQLRVIEEILNEQETRWRAAILKRKGDDEEC